MEKKSLRRGISRKQLKIFEADSNGCRYEKKTLLKQISEENDPRICICEWEQTSITKNTFTFFNREKIKDYSAAIAENGLFNSNISIDLKSNGVIRTQEKAIEPYDPFEHRDMEHPSSNMRSFANLLKSSLGSGILAMPAAFKNAGTVVGILGTIILGYICTHCVFMLVKTSQDVCKVVKAPSLGYAETVEAVFITGPKPVQRYSKFARIFLDCAMAVTILGACSVYVLLLVDSAKQIFDHFYGDYKIEVPYYCAMTLLPFLLFTQIKNLKYIAPFSALANLLLVVTFAICLYYILLDFPDVRSRPTSVDVMHWPLFVGTVIFAMEGIGVVLPVENNMKSPEFFLSCPGVLNISMCVVVALYMAMGFLGFVRYGDDIMGSITLNLPMNDVPALMAKCFIAIAIFFTYILQFYVPMEIIWRNAKDWVPEKHHNIAQVLMRAFFATETVTLAAGFPKLEQVIGLQGAFFYSFLGLIAPSILEIIFLWNRGLGKYNWILYKNIFLAVFGTFVLVTGCTTSIFDIIHNSK